MALIAALYWGVNTKPPTQKMPPTAQADEHEGHDHAGEVGAVSTDSIIAAAMAALPEHALEEAKTLKEMAMFSSNSEKIIAAKHQLAQLLQQHKQIAAAAYYYTEAAKLENSEKRLNFASRLNSDLSNSAESPSVRAWANQQAIAGFEQSLKVNPNNDTVKIALAYCYVDGSSQPMQGIQLLLGIVRENPDNIPANLMLGQFSIRSGQLDKAQERFEKVLAIEPKNTEAMYFLAEVYKDKGNKTKAIELLEECKRIVNNEAFSRDIDNYIKSFK